MILTLFAIVSTASSDWGAEAPSEAEIAAVKAHLGPLQLASFWEQREYCGYLFRDNQGALGFTEMVPGEVDACTPLIPLKGVKLVASIHTHGAYDPNVSAELPTVLDMQSDRREKVNGFVSTPGGRLWFIDTRRGEVRQICGLECLPQDPNFRPGDDGLIAQHYTYRELVGLESRQNQ